MCRLGNYYGGFVTENLRPVCFLPIFGGFCVGFDANPRLAQVAFVD